MLKMANKEDLFLYPPVHAEEAQNGLVIGRWKPLIEQWLRDDKSNLRSSVHTAKRIYDRLVEEYPGEFTGD